MTMTPEIQIEELLVLESIYPDFIEASSNNRIRLCIPVNPTEPSDSNFIISKDEDEDDQDICSPNPSGSSFKHLPPVQLLLILTSTYPDHEPPHIRSISSTHTWLNPLALETMEANLKSLWRPGELVLCSWIEYVLSGEFLRNLGCLRLTSSTARILNLYNESTTGLLFASQAFTCPVCQRSVKGVKSIQLSCHHVICRECLSDYWTFSIENGDVDHVCCPVPGCMGQDNEAIREEINQILPPELTNRLHWLREKRLFDRDPTVSVCPIPSCQKSVPALTHPDDEDSGWSRFRDCPTCSFAFCSVCRRTWHGPHTPCVASTTAEYVFEYMALEEGSPGRLALERRFGRALLRMAVAQYEEDRLNERVFDDSTTRCPGCNIRIEKSLGCNHMTCIKCKQHFCYLCGERLKVDNPYRHYSVVQSPCYNKLFDLNSSASPNDLR